MSAATVIRPVEPPRQTRWDLVIALPLILLALLEVAISSTSALTIGGVVAFWIAVHFAGRRWSRPATLTLDRDTLVHEGLRTRTLRPARTVSVRILPAHDHLLWLDERGRCRLTLDERGWDPQAIEALRGELGIPHERVEDPLTPSQAAKRYPGSMPRASAAVLTHPVASATAVLAAIAVVATAAT